LKVRKWSQVLKSVSFSLSRDHVDKVEGMAEKRGITKSAMVRKLIEDADAEGKS